jgi:hypothetical protein
VRGPKNVQQEVKWTAKGTIAQKIEARQLVQPNDEGMNRLKVAVPLRGKDGHPKFKDALPRHGNCWCDPKSGYHLSFSGKDKCPSKYLAGGGAEVDAPNESLNKTKEKPKDTPKPCTVDAAPGKLC